MKMIKMKGFKIFAAVTCLSFLIDVALPVRGFAFDAGNWDTGGNLGDTSTGAAPTKEGKDIPPNNPSEDNKKLDPVFVDKGEFSYPNQDIFIPSRGLAIDITRLYRSQRDFNGRFGYGWFFNFYIQIKKLSNNNMLLLEGATGRKNEFTYNAATSSYAPPAGVYDALAKNQDGTCTLTNKDGTKYNFDLNGNLSSIVDRNLNQISFTYDPQGKLPITGRSEYFVNLTEGVIAYDYLLTKITDSVGREISFAYNAKGRLQTITDFAGRAWTYGYDDNDNLISVTNPPTPDYPQGATTTYNYDTKHNLTSIVDAKGQAYITNYYDSQDRVDSQVYGAGTAYLSYDETNRKTTVTDRKGYQAIWAYNTAGNPVSKEEITANLRLGDPASYITAYEYNANMERTKVIYPKGNSASYTYDSKGNILEIRRKPNPATDPLPADIVTAFTYESRFNFIKTAADSKGSVTTYYYDYEEATLGDLNGDGVTDEDKGNLVKISYPAVDGQTSESKFTYNAYGQALTVTDPNGTVTKYEYDPATGYLLKTIQAFGSLNITTEMTYDSVGNVKTIKDPKGNITSFEYDSHNNLIKTTSPAPFNYITKNTYDKNDNLIQVDKETKDTNNPWQTTYFTYTVLDKIETVKDELNNLTTFGYDANGNKNLVKDAELNTTTYTYDERDLLWKVTDAEGGITEYSYDENGNLKEIKDAKGNTTTYTYDDFDRLLKTTYADTTYEEYAYDANSNLKAKTDPKGQAIYYEYDALNRLNKKGLSPKGTVPESVVTYAYDKGSRLKEVTDGAGTIAYGYDAANRIIQVTYPDTKAVSYTYDANSNRAKLTYPDTSFISYEYDQLNRLTAIKDYAGTNIASYTYDALSRRTRLDYANTAFTTYAYDDANRLSALVNKNAASTISSFNYTYDKVSNRKTMATLDGTHTYTYDKLYQLKSVDYPVGYAFPDISFTYDLVGSRTQTLNSGTTAYTANSLNQYTQVGAASYTHDANGSLTNDGTFTYAYDYENRLVIASQPQAGEAIYTYDPLGRRIEKTVNGTSTTFFYDGDQVIAEYDGAGNLIKKYIYGSGIDEIIKGLSPAGTVPEWYYHYDGLGSVSNLTDSSGAAIESYSYDAFGNPVIKDAVGSALQASIVGNTRMFTGREYDAEIGLYYYRARYYSPTTGRFLQRDPVGYTAGINLYSYCDNNPLNFIDPMGLDKEKPAWQKWWEWYLYESVVPGPYGQPMSEWGPRGPTSWGDPMKYTERAGGGWMWAERSAVGLTTFAALSAPALAFGLSAGESSILYYGPNAWKLAAASSGTPIFKTAIGSAMNWIQKTLDAKLPQAVWDAASKIYAAGARGTVQVFSTLSEYSTDYSSTFYRIEAPIIEALGKAEMVFK